LTEKLSLSPEQTAKVSAINTEFSTKRKAIKEATTERGAAKEAMKALRGEQKAAIKAVLTAEQIAIFDTMKKGRRGGKGRELKPETLSTFRVLICNYSGRPSTMDGKNAAI